jgi:four helix bundle protein
MTSKTFQEVDVWKIAHAWVVDVYRLTARFPRHEVFGLTAQLRRAAVSVPGNFAEGYNRMTRADKARLYNIAQSSAEESRYYLILASDLGYASTDDLIERLNEVCGKLRSYTQGMLEGRGLSCPAPRHDERSV